MRSWLISDGLARDRMVDMDRRLQPVRRKVFAVLALGLLLSVPWVGWWTPIPLAIAAAFYVAADRFAQNAGRPEYVMFPAWVVSELLIALSVALAGPDQLGALSLLAIPVVTLVARFSGRGIRVGKWIAVALILAVGFGVAPQAVIDNPPLLMVPIGLVLAMTMFLSEVMRSDLEFRGRAQQALIDPLTGLLGRLALENRVEELQRQSAVTGDPIGLIVADVDKFKAVNDLHGHAGGDAVLREIAQRLRRSPRAYDSIYRLGGDEFVILLPSAGLREVEGVAGRLCEAVRATLCAGVRVTLCCGVATSRAGAPFDFEATFADADRALLAAKAQGGDCLKTARRPIATTSSAVVSAPV